MYMKYKTLIYLLLRVISKLNFELAQFQTVELIPRLQFDHQAFKDTKEMSRKVDKLAIV